MLTVEINKLYTSVTFSEGGVWANVLSVLGEGATEADLVASWRRRNEVIMGGHHHHGGGAVVDA